MARNKSPSHLNSRVVRINLGTYQLLADLATKNDLSIAEALDALILGQTIRARPVIARSQIPMSPVLTYRAKQLSPMIAKPVPATISPSIKAIPALSVNGNKHVAPAGIKPKGGTIHG